jgi:SAM-dependent methyltransferase
MATDRLASEREFHDRQAQDRSLTYHLRPDALSVEDDAYLAHETWIRPAFAKLGNLQGIDVLDYGCGHGLASVVLARHGAHVTACDLSPGYLQEAYRRTQANGVKVQFVQVDGERLPFLDQSFDRIWGNAILHHLNLEVAGRELRRVLRPGGLAVFCEPWGENPFLNWARRRLTYPDKQRTRDEQPLRRSDLAILRNYFPGLEWQGYQFLSMIRRVFSGNRMMRALQHGDDWLLALPFLQRFCRYIVLTLPR